MRLQLSGGAAAVALLLLLAAPAAAGEAQVSTRVTYFREPSTTNAGITVIHPQTELSGSLRSWTVSAGTEVDVVSGATPAIFGPSSGIDAVTAATKFSDTRKQAHAGLAYERPDAGISAGYSYGWESDYRSHMVSASTHSDLVEHNFTLALSYAHNFDRVCDANNSAAVEPLDLRPLLSSEHCFDPTMPDVVTHHLAIDTFEPSLTWTMTPRLVVQGGGTIQILEGFQSNPYRSVLVGSQHHTPQEHLPDLRQRYALFGRLAYSFPQIRASGLLMARAYRDSWAVQSATGEAALNKYFGNALLITVRSRYHFQQGASFYRDAVGYRTLGPAGQYWTGDRELSPMSNYLFGGKLALLRRPQQERSSWFVEMELDAKAELLIYRLGSADAPNADRHFAGIIQGAFSMRF